MCISLIQLSVNFKLSEKLIHFIILTHANYLRDIFRASQSHGPQNPYNELLILSGFIIQKTGYPYRVEADEFQGRLNEYT